MAKAKKKNKRVTKPQSEKNAAARANMVSRIAAALVAAMSVWGVTKISAMARIANIRKNLLSLGTARRMPNGMTIVYGDDDIRFYFAKAKHVKGAKRKVDGECPLARALKDSFLSEYITHAHVGNHTVKLWSVMCPDVVVKFTLSAALAAVVRQWDEEGKWVADDGLYALCPYPEQSRVDKNGQPARKPRKAERPYGPPTKSRTRRITLQSDIALAMEMAKMMKKPKKKS